MHWRRVARWAAVSIGLAVFVTVLALPLAVRAAARALVLVLNGYVWVAMSISAGMSVWGVLAAIGRSLVAALATPTASATLVGLVAVGALALYGLQRLLGSEGEPFE